MLRLGFSNSYVWRLDFLRLGVINSYVRGLVFLRLVVSNTYVSGAIFLSFGRYYFLLFRLSVLTFGG